MTPQRQGILKLLHGNRTHPSAESIYGEIRKQYPRISFATVYNTLAKLAETGKIQELDIDPNKKRFDPSVVPHHHFYCKQCGTVLDVPEDSLPRMDLPRLRSNRVDGHEVEGVQLNLKGVCRTCRRNNPAAMGG
ncbi:MAG TPA: transcriptional repressor [Thermodesulfobacteriota bacterium]|nr:transcriptional repressor [Thermodesulfobacteriota bacterium]